MSLDPSVSKLGSRSRHHQTPWKTEMKEDIKPLALLSDTKKLLSLPIPEPHSWVFHTYILQQPPFHPELPGGDCSFTILCV